MLALIRRNRTALRAGCIHLRRSGDQRAHLCPLHESRSKSWRFVALEIRVIATEKEALQPLCVPEYIRWYAFTLYFKEIDESVYSCRNGAVNEWISPGQLGRSASRRSRRPRTRVLDTCVSETTELPETSTSVPLAGWPINPSLAPASGLNSSRLDFVVYFSRSRAHSRVERLLPLMGYMTVEKRLALPHVRLLGY